MKRIRWYLGLPLAGLQKLALGVGFVVLFVTRTLQWINRGNKHHVWWPLMIAKRWVRGEPTYKYEDLERAGLQPLTNAQRKIADADERIVRVECVCGKRTCAARHGLYQPGLPLSAMFKMDRAELEKAVRANELELTIDMTQARVTQIAREFIASNPEMKARAEAEVRQLANDLIAKGFTVDEIIPAFKARGYDLPRSE